MSHTFFEAAINGDINAIQKCVSQGQDVNALDEEGVAATHYAAQKGHLGVLRYLIEEAGSDIELKALSNGRTALNFAAIRNQAACFAYLAGKGADVNTHDISGATLLHSILLRDYLEILRLFVKYGGDIFEIDDVGETSLHLAVDYASRVIPVGCVGYLLEMGVDPMAVNHDGHTALDNAKVNKRDNVAIEIERFLKAKHEQAALAARIAADVDISEEDFDI